MKSRNDFAHPSSSLSDQEKLNIKRSKGLLPCAECKRLKRRCDKKLPCTSCVQRGCGSICPTGTISNWAGKNLVLPSTTELHRKIDKMSSRIRQLEDALAILQRIVSPQEPHPLLREELLGIKLASDNGNSSVELDDVPSEELASALGTLSVNEDGNVKYFGPSAGSETLLSTSMEQRTLGRKDLSLPFLITSPGNLFNNSILNIDDPIEVLAMSLPPKPRAWSLFEAFFEHSWMGALLVTRQDLVDDFITPAYNIRASLENGTYAVSEDIVSLHKMALLFILFGFGALVDLTLTPFNDEAKKYYDLAVLGLSSRPVFSFPELATIQALSLCAMYHMQGGQGCTVDGIWMFVSVASKLAQSIGLHRESSKWNLDPILTERRRKVFWGLFILDTYVSLSLGRPPSFQLGYIDCQFPTDNDETVDENGDHQPGPFRWMYVFSKKVSSAVIQTTLSTTTPSYKDILKLDQKVRGCSIPTRTMMDISDSSKDSETPLKFMIQHILLFFRTATLLYIHRGFFVQAMLDYPSDPLRSPYAPSFLASYKCACDVIQLDVKYFNKFPSLMIRWWTFWNSLFSSAVIVGTICTRVQNTTMARQAFAELKTAIAVFEYGAPVTPRARNGLVLLHKLMNKATENLSILENMLDPVSTGASHSDSVRDPYFGMFELQTHGEHTKLAQPTAKQERPNDGIWSSGEILHPYMPNDIILSSLLTRSPLGPGKSSDPSSILDYAHVSNPPTTDDLPEPMPSFLNANVYNNEIQYRPIGSTSHMDSTSFDFPAMEGMNEIAGESFPDGYPLDFNMLGPGEDPIFNAQWAAFMQSVFEGSGESEMINAE